MDKSYLVEGYVESYSLWLEPKGKVAEQLQREINLLADTYPPAPHFPPHVTLLPDIEATGEQVVATAHELVQQLKKYNINFLKVTQGAKYFQCVYLLCAEEPDTMAAGALARKLYNMQTPPYMPHLSLLYSDIDDAQKKEVVQASFKRLYGEGSGYDTLLVQNGYEVSSVSVWYTPTEDKSTKSWCRVAEIPLSA
eukprot:CAMPEP_0202912074 /NCGR_PEP_ID=MMETSP1392-20130828/56776_1 /ASSEMBLY_ACC=CAM_ASM_000868 /TAXON_ID=225041 /ORGANISM="Chlamydomonas chlamydogama, Strain SAG 11-48b" /LENGTH=194 /DNA_ID=CAMNT_0049602859 /DNA_START=247 /DNA_END=831 /DNA_ORIENTATION=+